MKNLMISTAVVAFSAIAAQAQDASPFRTEAVAGEVYASDFIGMRVYAAETELAGPGVAGLQTDWDDIGEINDVILSREGTVDAVLVDIGGFLGMGERQVAVNMDAIRFVSDDATGEDPDDFFLVMTAADAMLQEAPAYSRMPGTDMKTDAEIISGQTTVAEAPASTDMTPGMMVTRDGYVAAEPDVLTAEKLTGARVYDATDADIGEVGSLILGADGQITEAVVDVGGFLGLGEKPVALSLSELSILRSDNGDDIRVYVSQTKEQLEAMPDYVK
ncbi:PRC-barrel domain containing protein [Pseudorhodobacter sp. E13]|uniref:PRC-barrel domain-containing protein n=1 Tax=Pseudorhodobacter sp. E13 TaxID=2487931 RepID=UPI000F8F7E73|nr:PRC-barrel domain-containing protein [Pseudorhodobacter sp. E13]RUS59813.1 PRC-barrel domain containing protein [Pseudorhodobacter sp. E13]